MENLSDAEFGSNKDGEEAPILVAQRYLNIFRQVHIFNKEKRDKFDELYAEKRKSQKLYEKMREEMLKEGYTSDEITAGVEIARIAYMKSIGIDVGEYLLYKIATNEKHADKDKSGGVSKQERETAIREMDIDEKIKNYFLNQHK